MKQKIKLCLIGAGRAGMIHAMNFAFRIPEAEMAAVSDVDPYQARKAAEQLNLDCWYDDYKNAIRESGAQAVIIAAPTKYHVEIAVEAARAGLHILCEKPMAMTPDECRRIEAEVQKKGVVLQLGFMRRFDAGFIRAKEILDSGEIGKLVMVKSITRGPSTPHEWMYDIEKSNGPLAEVNSHDIDTVRWITGSEVETLYATGGNYRCQNAAEDYPDFYDTVLLNLRMKNGVIGCIEGAQGVGYGYDARLEILGTKGCITVGSLKENKTTVFTKDGGMKGDIVKSWRNLFSEAYLKEDEDFVQCILNQRQPKASGRDGRKAVEIVRAGNRSLKRGTVESGWGEAEENDGGNAGDKVIRGE